MNWACALRAASTAGFLVLFACSGDAGSGASGVFSAELPVTEGAPAIWQRELPAGIYLVGARERDVDFQMTVEASGKRATLSDEVPRHGFQVAVIELRGASRLRVEITNADYPDWTGSAALDVRRLRDVDATPDDRELGFAAFGNGSARLAQATYAERETSVESFREAARIFTAARDIAARAEAHYALAFTEYYLRTDNAAALSVAELARADFEAAGDPVGIHDAITLRGMSNIEIAFKMSAAQRRAERQDLFRSADEDLRLTSEFFERRGLTQRRDYAFNVRGVGFIYAGDYESAAAICEEAVQRATAIGDTRERIKAAGNLAWVYNRLGHFDKSMRTFKEILPLAESLRDGRHFGFVLGNYGLTAAALGEFDTGLAAQTRSHALFAEHGMRTEAANALSSIAGIYLRIGDADRALKTYEQVIDEFGFVRDFSGQASALRMAGNAAANLGRLEESLALLRRAMQTEGRPVDVGRTRVLIARVLRELGDLRGAAQQIEQALLIDNLVLRASALDERGRLRMARGEPRKAIEDLRAADAGFAALGADLPRIDTNTALSAALLTRGDRVEAARVADVAIALENRIRVKSGNPEWRASFLSTSYSPYEARIAAELAGNERNPERVWTAFQIAARVRARALAEHLAASGTVAGDQAIAADHEVEFELLRARLTAQLGRLESRLQRSGPDDPTAIELRRVAEVTRAELAGAAAKGAASNSALALPESLRAVKASLPADLAVLAYFTGDRTTDIWMLSRHELRHARALGAKALEVDLQAFVDHLRDSASVRPGTKLSAALLGDLLAGVDAKRLMILADGPLNALPFAALPLPGSADERLVDRFVISMSPSLALALQGAAKPSSEATRVVVVSDPVFSRTDRRLSSAATERNSNLRDSRSLARLPYSAVEARAVVNAFGPRDSINLAGFDATPARVLELQNLPLRVLHFATHAGSADTPEDSALFLSRFGPDGAALDSSSLTADDITHSRLHADLVVLSGCATGEGRELRGGGVLGLTHGFLANGSRSVIASLWPIEDAPAARFMEEFYAAYRKSGRAADALRIAQLRTRNGPAKAVWSSFVVRANELP